MLGWMLNRGGQPHQDASGGPDDTQIDLPDTPAPIFAARALKSALFGTPAPPVPVRRDQHASQNASKMTTDASINTPAKPQGIMLTPGTGAARRKRVSFGQDVTQNDAGRGGKTAAAEGSPKKLPDAWPKTANVGKEPSDSMRRPRTAFSERLENSRKPKPTPTSAPTDTNTKRKSTSEPSESCWEEVVEESDRDPDVTVDLNEPHSRSGKYWKSEFQKYHVEAKSEMEKLVKYKERAKSYAKLKDTEAMSLNQLLRDEQAKVAQMESRLAGLAGQMAAKRMNGSDAENHEALRDLTRQTALAAQYRNQVKELEALIKDGQASDSEGVNGSASTRKRRVLSPRTNHTLLEAQRELRRAREQVKELNQLKNEFRKLKADLRAAEKHEAEIRSEKMQLEADLTSSNSKVEELSSKVTLIEERVRRKGEALERLQEDHDKLKEESRKSARESKAALRAKDDEIAQLRKKLERKSDSIAKETEAAALRPEELSEELNIPYSVDPNHADWTVNVTQLEDSQRRVEAAATTQRKSPKIAKNEPTGDTTGWTRRLQRLENSLAVEEPGDAEPRRTGQSRPKPGVEEKEDALDQDDFTHRLDEVRPTARELGREVRGQLNPNDRRKALADLPTPKRSTFEDIWQDEVESPLLRAHSRTSHRASPSTSAALNVLGKRSSSATLLERTTQENAAVATTNPAPTSFRHSIDSSFLDTTPRPKSTFPSTTATTRPHAALEPRPDRRLTRTAPPPPPPPAVRAAQHARPSSSESEEAQVDLLQGRFARLGAPVRLRAGAVEDPLLNNVSVVGTVNTTSRSALPPSRHAAALARLEQKRAARRRVGVLGGGHDKENVRP